MKPTKRFLRPLLLVGLVFVLMAALPACTRSASQAPTQAVDELPVPEDDSPFAIEATPTATTVVEPAPDAGGGQVQPEQPAATATPQPAAEQPAQQQPAVQDIKPTEGKPPATYTLQKGEFPFCIARRFNLNQSELLALNGLSLDSKPPVGTVLRLPQTGNGFVSSRSLKNHPTDYKVVPGDTIYSIACQFGDVSPDMIALANNLKEPYNLNAGDVIRIP